MAMRLQELHPALVHFPITLLPVSLAADALGRMTGSRSLMDMGRRTMPLAAASGMVAGLAGLIAQQSAKLDEHTAKQVVTHRNLNLGVIALTTILAGRRSRRARPGVGYLLAGLAGVAVTSYSAYLGGHMVYEHGVGVLAADGVHEDRAPELTPDRAAEAARLAGRLVEQGAEVTVRQLRHDPILPWITEPTRTTEPALAPASA